MNFFLLKSSLRYFNLKSFANLDATLITVFVRLLKRRISNVKWDRLKEVSIMRKIAEVPTGLCSRYNFDKNVNLCD